MLSFNNINQMHATRRIILIYCTLILLALSCDLTASEQQAVEEQKAALDIQMTVAAQKSTQDALSTQQSLLLTQAAADTQPEQAAPQPVETQPPPVQTTEPPIVQTEEPIAENQDDKIKGAKILLFESMAGTGDLELVQEALDSAGYSYKDDGSAEGWLKDDLLSTTDWNLIIASNEWRYKITGEYFTYLLDFINRGTAVIIEHWALDQLSFGKVAPILSRCGVAVQKNWYVETSGTPNLSLFPLVPDHPVFNEPNTGISLRGYENFWYDEPDKGDFLKVVGGDATLLAGTIATSKMDHGTLVTCIDGRLIIQTHSTHEYRRESSVALWQNMIYYTLKNHFQSSPN